MNKREFLDKLREESRDESAVKYYDELISDRVEAGEDETSVIASYDIKKIARAISYESAKRELSEKSKERKGPKGWIVFVALCSAPVTIPLALSFAVIVLSLYVTAFSLVFAGIAGLVWIVGGLVELSNMGEEFKFLLLNGAGGLATLGVVGIVGYYMLRLLRFIYDRIIVAFFRLRKKKEDAKQKEVTI